ncbi:MAG: hypothetical protein JKY52_08335 [Flavobacteriales bacterium]|nr:hypothetical protein [Flavobacteriales bacterium]
MSDELTKVIEGALRETGVAPILDSDGAFIAKAVREYMLKEEAMTREGLLAAMTVLEGFLEWHDNPDKYESGYGIECSMSMREWLVKDDRAMIKTARGALKATLGEPNE